MRSPLPCVAPKKIANRQSKSMLMPINGEPDGQFPSVGTNSVATTVIVNGVSTCGIVSAMECAFGSMHGFSGVGSTFIVQSNVAIFVVVVSVGTNGRFFVAGGGRKFAITEY